MGVYDLEGIVSDWAKENYKEGHLDGANDAEKARKIKNISMEIDWGKVRMSTTSTKPVNGSENQKPDQVSNVVFKSKFRNNTEETQKHHFNMDKTTEATVRTSLTKGFSKNGLVGIKISVPENVMNLTSSFGDDISVVSEDNNVVKHVVSWGLDSEVQVPKKKKTFAEMKIAETVYKCDFSSEVVLRGKVIVRILSENPPIVIEKQLSTLLDDRYEDLKPYGLVSIVERKVTWSVTGRLQFRFGVCQDVKVWSKGLDETSDDEDDKASTKN